MSAALADNDLESFRSTVKAWLKDNFPASLKGKAYLTGTPIKAATGDLLAWRKAIGEKGWATPTWPKEYGGGGLSGAEAKILRDEMNDYDAFNPLNFGMGITMVGPTILDYGTEEQKREHLPRIIKGEVQWCIGYSEPNAGSDLASLQTRAVDAGDEWVFNGQKTWTSGASEADWCGLLARTDPKAKKHEGISFFLVDMHQPGVRIRPIVLISGSSPFCETFLTDAKAPKNALLGEINKGWTVGKRLLQHERASQTGGRAGLPPKKLSDIAKKYVPVDEKGRLVDTDLRGRIAENMMATKIHDLTIARVMAEARGNNNPSHATSILKNSATTVAQGRNELLLEIAGLQGLGWEGANFQSSELDNVRTWLYGKAMSIYGGSVEIQNNIISKRVLGLPDSTNSA